jgi:hypothetical protein
MKRALAASLLCMLHLAFIVMPEVQLWPYLNAIAGQQKSNEPSINKSQKSPLTGDITYLKALVERSKKMDDTKKENKIPETTVTHTGLTYLPCETIDNSLFYREEINYFVNFQKHPHRGINNVLFPPPKVTFC